MNRVGNFWSASYHLSRRGPTGINKALACQLVAFIICIIILMDYQLDDNTDNRLKLKFPLLVNFPGDIVRMSCHINKIIQGM